jgi:NAD(P)-dependent dehydrogenase (short-subunit alcohol dehydrogenase family)
MKVQGLWHGGISPLQHKVAVVTGASHGLGFEISRKYLEAGANLMICARDEQPLDAARQRLASAAGDGQVILAVAADVSREADVARVVDATLRQFGRVDILVNNAGVYGPKGPVEEVDWAQWVRAIEINLLGAVLTCRAVLPHFKAVGGGKIIQLSGGGATKPLPMISAYAASKAAVIRFIETLAEEVREWHIDVNAIAPGALNTRMLEEVLEAGPAKVGLALHERSVEQKATGGVPLNKGAELAVFLGSALSDGITGKLISAVWDPWQGLAEHRDDLSRSDVYTLRRIVPKDRGMSWGDDL